MNKKIRKTVLPIAMTIITTTMSMGALSNNVFAAPLEQTVSITKSDISYSGENAILDAQFDKIVSQLRDYKTKNPNASTKSLNDYANSLLLSNQTNGLNAVTQSVYTDMDGYISGYLNPLEQALYDSNKAYGLLCMANGKLALNYATSYYANTEAVQHNGNGDAFRHTLWNFGMALDVGSSFAKQWSDAHENGTSNNPAIEKQMDLFNNGVGLYQASLYPYPSSIANMIQIVINRVNVGGCEIIVSGKIVNSNSVGKL